MRSSKFELHGAIVVDMLASASSPRRFDARRSPFPLEAMVAAVARMSETMTANFMVRWRYPGCYPFKRFGERTMQDLLLGLCCVVLGSCGVFRTVRLDRARTRESGNDFDIR